MANAHAHPIPPAIPHDLFTQEVPPSPTLTNPDMILPYQPHLDSSPGPRAPSPILRSSPLPVRPDSAVSLGSSPPELEPAVELGIATTIRMPSRAVPPINTNYHGYEHGAPLSDIGEEETPKSKKSRRTESPMISDPPSPTPAGPFSRVARRLSNHSSSSNGSDLGNWEDFDTSKIMNGRLAADVAKVPDEEIEEPDSKRNSTTTTSAEDEMALLNERAERILEHARKRLTHMEDNLSKARHSILLSSRSSPNINELHQPAGGLYRSISLAGASQRKPRPLHLVNRNNSVAHARGGSDTTTGASGLKRLSMIPEIRSASALEYGRRQESPQQLLHSPSARGGPYSPASNRSFNSPLRVLKEEESPPSTTKTTPDSSAPRGLGINTLAAVSKEDISVVTSSPTTALARSSSAMSNRSTKEIREQMSNLQARISDLKDKAQADSLRRKSLQSMRTPSPFASAHSPEQWYTSAPEYKEAGSPINTNAGMGWSPSQPRKRLDFQVTPVTPQAQTLLNVELPATRDSGLVSEARTDKNTPSLHKSVHLQPEPVEKSNSVLQESLYEDAAQEFDDDEPIAASEEEQIYLNEVLEESLQDLEPDVPEIPEHLLPTEGAAERHEDRLDAFDYENMFLHSALGNYTGTGIRSETPSESDCSSVTTTRMAQDTPTIDEDDTEIPLDEEAGTEEAADTPIQETFLQPGPPLDPTPLAAPSKPWMKAARSNSMDSVSTVATFATATEGGGAGDGEAEDGMPTEILSWGNSAPFPQPPMSPKRENTASVWPTPPMSGRARQGQNRSPRQIQTQGSIVSNGIPTPPVHSPNGSFPTPRAFGPATAPNEVPVDHPANTEILMESLIKLADPEFRVGEGPGSVTFSNVDKDLVLDLLRAVGGVCNEILRSERKHEVRAAKVLRRRLDESRKLLEGRTDE
ncbi:uncharacterized protein Z519_03706 [Cladophialophora bantiana CBS 173.52]|uniref:Uncharacterized protein n=1 Tax=Cladophialophora bantiana (strain ATCC 10958 / CBS 173.52 / CDC B-1940 / NIH 8579) TaxID=1442370 RepID=A0A0D2G949_CLAB1|nr:uncharacterized protein Z519_03706 [Cladophialophora bantiana CBS 173.52]KIW95122.1 hypothetical protein Z519_03706 [Cladophialophora bantiana CBS 173.52]